MNLHTKLCGTSIISGKISEPKNVSSINQRVRTGRWHPQSLHLFWRKWNCHQEWAFWDQPKSGGSPRSLAGIGMWGVRWCEMWCWRSAPRHSLLRAHGNKQLQWAGNSELPFLSWGTGWKHSVCKGKNLKILFSIFPLVREIDFASRFSKALFSCQSWWLLGNVACKQVTEVPASRNRDCEFPDEV